MQSIESKKHYMLYIPTEFFCNKYFFLHPANLTKYIQNISYVKTDMQNKHYTSKTANKKCLLPNIGYHCTQLIVSTLF